MRWQFLILIGIIFTMTSCEKRHTSSMTVIKDCTGTYLRLDGKDFPICNYEILSGFEDGVQVIATYKKIGDGVCAGKGVPHCMMPHSYNTGEWIEILKLK